MSRVVKIHCTEWGCRNWATTDQDHSRLARAGWRTWRTEAPESGELLGKGVAVCPQRHAVDVYLSGKPAEVLLALARALEGVPPESLVEVRLRPSTDAAARGARIQLNIDKGGQ